MRRGRRDGRQWGIRGCVGLRRCLADEASRGSLWWRGGEGEVGGGIGRGGGAERGVYVHSVIVRVCVCMGVGLGVRDGQWEFGASTRPPWVVESVRGSWGDRGVRGQRRRCGEAGCHVVA